MPTTLEKNETAILSRALSPENGNLPPEAAHAILAIELSPADRGELRRLVELARTGALSAEDEADLENYRHVGRLLELLKSKARMSLQHPAGSADEPRT